MADLRILRPRDEPATRFYRISTRPLAVSVEVSVAVGL
jgi:hypothetical protein